MTSPAVMAPHVFADLGLARRLERAEAMGCVDFVEARARIFPETGAAWLEVAGAHAMFDGVLSPITQTFGLGMSEPLCDAHLDAIESFFRERGAGCSTKSARWPMPPCSRCSTSVATSPSISPA